MVEQHVKHYQMVMYVYLLYLYLLFVLLCSMEAIIVSLCANKDIIIIQPDFQCSTTKHQCSNFAVR